MKSLLILIKRAARPDTAPAIVDFAQARMRDARQPRELGPNQTAWLANKHADTIGHMQQINARVATEYYKSASQGNSSSSRIADPQRKTPGLSVGGFFIGASPAPLRLPAHCLLSRHCPARSA